MPVTVTAIQLMNLITQPRISVSLFEKKKIRLIPTYFRKFKYSKMNELVNKDV